jgi:hypothetical protein
VLRSRALIAVSVAAAALMMGSLMMGSIAPAAGLSEESSVTLNVSKAPTFRGNVTSPDRFCHADRKVVLYAFSESGRYFFGTDRTNQKGKWQISEQLDGATTFQAAVKAQKAKGLLCKAAFSGVKTVPFG